MTSTRYHSMSSRLRGLVAATYTPFNPDLSLALDSVPPLVERLLADGVSGLYVCGSTGEGVSLSTPERKQVAEAFVAAAAGRVPVVVQVGHNSLAEACDLAAHAQAAGADATSAMPPTYFKPGSIEMLVECCREIAAAAPDLPFYYYHIPVLSGVSLSMTALLERAGNVIPNLAGLKYTANTLHEYQQCVALEGGRFDVLYGFDELLLPAVAVGAAGAVGSTFNIAAPLYRRVLESFARGDIEAAREAQLKAVDMITTIARYPFHPAMKLILGWLGTPVGGCRPPLPGLSPGDEAGLRAGLEAIGFFDWSRPLPTGTA
jgi:N-acetylneuraminate lyase